MIGPTACTTCRSIRRFLLAFGAGVFLFWHYTGSLPFEGRNADLMRVLLIVVILFYGFSIVIRLRQMRQKWRR